MEYLRNRWEPVPLNTREHIFMRRGTAILWMVFWWLFVLDGAIEAQVPAVLSFHGRILVGSNVFSGTGQFKFALVNTNGSQSFWVNSPDANLDGEPDNAVSITVDRGLYSAPLGDTNLANMAAISPAVFTNHNVSLRVWFNDGIIGFQALAPDQRITSVSYAMVAATVDDGAITLAKLAPDTWEALSNHVETVMPSGLTLVSPEAQDATLTAKGYQSFMSVPAPAWVNGTTANALNPRYRHTAVWTGQAMIIWGGNLGGGYITGAGSAYDPALDQWLTVSPIDAPSARSGHTAVWTGEEMIVWGGYAAGNYLNTGGRYRPANQQWSPLLLTGVPSGRDAHIAVWTGSRLIVWGGRNSQGLLADGASLTLSDSQWIALSEVGAPTARRDTTGVWTGNRLIVWGGEGTNGPLDTGAQLVFDTNGAPGQWQKVGQTKAPSARSRHSAVWTGQKMIVWGGQTNSNFLNDGGIYDPATDAWTLIPASSAVSSRAGHCALWTGQEMIVLNGENAAGATASGAAYNPARGQWRVLSSTGNPQPRTDATAVWTGTELLVFGGRANGQPVGSLQRLNPQSPWYFYRKP
jgi:N-acetylneuraminic acid mutarotase